MPISKHQRTVAMTENIKKAQRSKRYTDEEVANHLGISVSAYKNIIRSLPPEENKKRFIKDSIINDLASLYDCSTDYILGLSNDMAYDKNGRFIIRPFNFNKDKLLNELCQYLVSEDSNPDHITLNDLHFLLCECGQKDREKYLETLHTYANLLRDSLTLELFKQYSKRDYNLLIKNTKDYGKEYTSYITYLCKANEFFQNGDFKSALKAYLEIIYATITKSLTLSPIANRAVEKVLLLFQNWVEFPSKFTIIVDVLPEIQARCFCISELSAKKLLESSQATSNINAYEGIDLSKKMITIMKQLIKEIYL